MLTWVLFLVILGVCVEVGEGVVQLDMAPDSVDDMYVGCEQEMEERVHAQLLEQDKSQNVDLRLALRLALKHYYQKWSRRQDTLGREQIIAAYIYTLDLPRIYENFNAAVRTGRAVYTTTFGYNSLHFFLTTAVRALNTQQRRGDGCLVSFRRANTTFSRDVLHREIRFGSFTSSTLGKYPSRETFGDKSCFEISTCHGADISVYSKFEEAEGEVLIPPYEVFNVTRVQTRDKDKTLECDVVYTVASTRRFSNLNCAFFIP